MLSCAKGEAAEDLYGQLSSRTLGHASSLSLAITAPGESLNSFAQRP